MSEEDSPDLTKSWVFVDPEKKSFEEEPPATSGVEEVDNHADSDTDSISVISESGCSYKTDEEEFVPAPTPSEVEPQAIAPEITEVESPKPTEIAKPPENATVEKLLYFATSAACALVLIGFSILVQNYFYASSDVNKFSADLDQPITPYVQSVKNQDGDMRKSYSFKRKSQSKGEERIKNQKVYVYHDKITSPSEQFENNDLTVEGDVKSNYKLSKNKSPATKFNKENCDDSDKRTKNDEFKKKIKSNDFDEINKDGKKFQKYGKTGDPEDETINKKIQELKLKEAYLREKEKFLIEKEHKLMKREIKLKEKKKSKKDKRESEEYNSKEKKDKYKTQKKIDDDTNQKINKKFKNREDKRQFFNQNKKIIDDSQHKKRNMSGQWYIELHKARTNIRQKEHASDWVFDRAHLRSLKRNNKENNYKDVFL